MSNKEYVGAYTRLFPSKISTNSVMTVYVLWLLSRSDEKMYGKEIIDEIEQRFQSTWKPSHGIVYPLLRDLEEAGLVYANWEDESGSKKTKRMYAITAKGRDALQEQLSQCKPLIQESKDVINRIMFDLYKEA